MTHRGGVVRTRKLWYEWQDASDPSNWRCPDRACRRVNFLDHERRQFAQCGDCHAWVLLRPALVGRRFVEQKLEISADLGELWPGPSIYD